jgi:uncharacterized protein involved in exopolysaccharide biosynthesis
MQKEVSLLDVLHAIVKQRLFLFIYVFTCLILFTTVAFLLPKKYESSVTFVRESTSPGGSLGGLLGNLGSLGMSGSSKLNTEAALVLLQSQELREQVVEHFDLYEVYDKEILLQVLKTLDSNITISETREGGLGFNPITAISVTVKDEDPTRAKEIADYFVIVLDGLMVQFNSEIQQKTVGILNERYDKNMEDMQNAENAFKEFQEEFGIIELEEQTKAFVQNLATLQAEKTALDIEIKALERLYGANAKDQVGFKRLQYEQIEESVRELTDKAELSTSAKDGVYPLKSIPELGFRYLNLYRDFEVQQTIFETLLPQLELNKMYLADRNSGIQVIDPAKIPTYKSSPKRAFIMAGGLLFGIFSGLVLVFFRQLGKELNDESNEMAQKWAAIKREFVK